MAGGAVDALEGDLQHEAEGRLGAHRADRAEAVRRVVAHEAVEHVEFGIGEAEIGFSDGHQHVALRAFGPHTEGEIGIVARAFAVAALGIHHHGIDIERIALPLEPRPLHAAGLVGAVEPLDHHALDDRIGRIAADLFQRFPAFEGHERRKVEAAVRRLFDEAGKALAALGEGGGAHVHLAFEKHVIGAHEGREILQHLCTDRLAVQPLLEIGEGAGRAVGARRAADQKLAIHHAFEIHGVEHIRKGGGDIVAGAGIEFSRFT